MIMGPVHTARYFSVIKGLRGELKTDTLRMYYHKALHHLVNELTLTSH